jgi:hypothetical protein
VRVAAALVHVGVVRDAEDPYQDVASLVELVPMRERPLQGGLHQVVGGAAVEDQ